MPFRLPQRAQGPAPFWGLKGRPPGLPESRARASQNGSRPQGLQGGRQSHGVISDTLARQIGGQSSLGDGPAPALVTPAGRSEPADAATPTAHPAGALELLQLLRGA